MNIIQENFQTHLRDKLTNAKMRLMVDEGFYPLFVYALPDGSIKEMELDFEVTSKDDTVIMLRDLCKNCRVQIAGLMFCAYVVVHDLNDPAQKNRVIGTSLKDEKDASEEIILYVYTPENTKVRRVPYVKKADKGTRAIHDYLFSDGGWEDVTETLTGRFSNPLK